MEVEFQFSIFAVRYVEYDISVKWIYNIELV